MIIPLDILWYQVVTWVWLSVRLHCGRDIMAGWKHLRPASLKVLSSGYDGAEKYRQNSIKIILA